MKLRIITLSVLLTMVLWLASCLAAASIQVSCNDFSKQQHISKKLNLAVGDTFAVTLCSNPSTGFQWSESAKISDSTVVQQTDHKFLSPGTGLTGAPGKEVWTLKALNKGTSTISLEYGRPWEGGEKAEWTFNLTVVVK